jgi:hypothetical protein
MDLAIGLEIFLLDKSGFGPYPDFCPLGAEGITRALRWTQHNTNHSVPSTSEVKRGWMVPAVPKRLSTIVINMKTASSFCLHLCPVF